MWRKNVTILIWLSFVYKCVYVTFYVPSFMLTVWKAMILLNYSHKSSCGFPAVINTLYSNKLNLNRWNRLVAYINISLYYLMTLYCCINPLNRCMDKVCYSTKRHDSPIQVIYLLFLFTQIITLVYVFIFVLIRSQETRLS